MSNATETNVTLTAVQDAAWLQVTRQTKGKHYRDDVTGGDKVYGEPMWQRIRRVGRTCTAMMAVDESLQKIDLLTAYFTYAAMQFGHMPSNDTPAKQLGIDAYYYMHDNATIGKQTRNVAALLYAVTHDEMRCSAVHHPKDLMDTMIEAKLLNQVYGRRIAGTLKKMGISFINDYPHHPVIGMRTANDLQNIKMQEQFVGLDNSDNDNIAFENALHDQIRSFKRGK